MNVGTNMTAEMGQAKKQGEKDLMVKVRQRRPLVTMNE